MLLKQKVVLISREVIERARQRDEQTSVDGSADTVSRASVCTSILLTSYTVNARYAEPAFGRLTTRAIIILSTHYHLLLFCTKCSGTKEVLLATEVHVGSTYILVAMHQHDWICSYVDTRTMCLVVESRMSQLCI